MRFLCLLILLAVGGAVAVFAYQNQQPLTLHFLDYTMTYNVAVVVAAAYVLGMISGWTVIGMLRRSYYRVTEAPPAQREYATR